MFNQFFHSLLKISIIIFVSNPQRLCLSVSHVSVDMIYRGDDSQADVLLHTIIMGFVVMIVILSVMFGVSILQTSAHG